MGTIGRGHARKRVDGGRLRHGGGRGGATICAFRLHGRVVEERPEVERRVARSGGGAGTRLADRKRRRGGFTFKEQRPGQTLRTRTRARAGVVKVEVEHAEGRVGARDDGSGNEGGGNGQERGEGLKRKGRGRVARHRRSTWSKNEGGGASTDLVEHAEGCNRSGTRSPSRWRRLGRGIVQTGGTRALMLVLRLALEAAA